MILTRISINNIIMATKKKQIDDLYTIPDNRIGKTVYTGKGPITLDDNTSPEDKIYLVSQGVKLIKKEAEEPKEEE